MPPSQSPGDAVIARQLTGELYCIGCGYNLRGLSIRAACPECGVPVRATILGIVDPHAGELTPLYFPRVSAVGICAWSFGATLAVLMVWLLRGAEVVRDVTGGGWVPAMAPWVGIAGLVASMLGAATMVRPHKGVRRAQAIRSALGVSMYGALILVYGAIYLGYDSGAPSPVIHPSADSLGRSALRLLMFVLVAGIIWGLRPQAIGLAVRSVVVRTGRVDRQSMLAVLASLGIAAIGDLLAIVGHFVRLGQSDAIAIVTVVVIALGSVLFTVGMLSICLDSIRLFPVLVRPGVGLSDILESNREKSRREERI